MTSNQTLFSPGEYKVRITGISGSLDPTVIKTASIDLTILLALLPCQVQYLLPRSIVQNITFPFGSNTSITTNAYSFAESPYCGYNQTITFTGLPSFVIHNPKDKTFTVMGPAILGTYTVVILSEIKIPTDAAKTLFKTLSA